MDKISIDISDLGSDYSLSPEHWLSIASAREATGGIPFSSIAHIGKKTKNQLPDFALVLDTGNSDRGLLTLPEHLGLEKSQRSSAKKTVPEGAVLISRLRPYLKQVTYVPRGACATLGVSGIFCSTEYYVLSAVEDGSSIAFLVPWLLSPAVQTVLEKATKGGHHPRFSDELLETLTIPEELVNRRAEVSDAVEQAVLQHLSAQLSMAALRTRLAT